MQWRPRGNPLVFHHPMETSYGNIHGFSWFPTLLSPLDMFDPGKPMWFSCVPMRSHVEAATAHWKPWDLVDSRGFPLVTMHGIFHGDFCNGRILVERWARSWIVISVVLYMHNYTYVTSVYTIVLRES